MKLNKNSIFYHCLLLSSSSVVLQLLGFGYRILLGRLAGAQAIAVYGLVMSAYNVVLSCTLTGVALSVSRIASGYLALGQGRSIIRLIRTALTLFIGLFCLLAVPFGLNREFFASRVLGNPQTAPALLLIVPCLFLTGFENVHKAYFYGTGQTFAPTISETLEMLCRIAAAVVLFGMVGKKLDAGQAAALIVCGMVISELVSSVFLTTLYRIKRKKLTGKDD
ncbi:MAG: stage V sporulation protein B, partial [Negativibacillus sp.]|nr:stage V sporulation protein B [Negativibacillus sp.]